MAVRLVVTFHTTPGKGAELAQAMKARCEVSRQDAGCEQFEVFQSVFDPDKLVLLELWKDQAALDAHGWRRSRTAPARTLPKLRRAPQLAAPGKGTER
jgi:quinol monooxygenase YgiN